MILLIWINRCTGAVMHYPSAAELQQARTCQRLGEYQKPYYSLVSVTAKTIVVMFAGHCITYRYDTNAIQHTPKHPAGLSNEDMGTLEKLVYEIFGAVHEGHRRVNTARQREAKAKQALKAQADFFEKYGPQGRLF